MPGRAKADELDPKTATFDQMFRATARRVLKRHGVPDSRIEPEIERLRKVEPAFAGPTFDEVTTANPGGGDKR